MKNLKKYRYPIIIIVVILTGLITFGSKMSKPEKELTTEEFLYEAGFKTVPTLTESRHADYWKQKYNLRFISDSNMKILCDSNGFIIKPTDNYIENVPVNAAAEMKKNYEKIKNDLLVYEFHGWDDGITSWMEWEINNNREIGTWGNVGALLFTLSGDEVKANIRHKERWRGEVTRLFPQFDREQWIDDVIKPETIKRFNLIPQNYTDNWIMVRNHENDRIKIVAHYTKFDAGSFTIDKKFSENLPTHVPLSNDPLAVIKHRGGWIVLSHWL